MTLISAVPPVIQFLQSLLLGTLLSLLYDAFYTIRGLFPAQAQPHVILDILYFLLFGVLLFNYLLMESAGRLRYFIILGVIIGWLLYHNTVSRLVIRFFNWLLLMVHRVFSFLLSPIITLAQRLFHSISTVCKKTTIKRKTPKNSLKKPRWLLYNKVSKNSMEENGNEKAPDHQTD